MEVHHPKRRDHARHWVSHLTEFFMLFLAVTLGFFAENLRETHIEQERAHELIKAFEYDVRANIHFIDSLLEQGHKMEYEIDTALLVLEQAEDTFDLDFFYRRVRYEFPKFLSKNDTYEQMKNSGALRYVKDQALAEKMVEYSSYSEGAEYRSREQEASFVLGEFSGMLMRWFPPELSIQKYLYSYDRMAERLQSPDSTTRLLKKMDRFRHSSPHLIRGEGLQQFKRELIPVLTRRLGLMKTTMSFLINAKQKGLDILTYLEQYE